MTTREVMSAIKDSAGIGASNSYDSCADKQAHRIKHSPTLLFDILVESDKDKQQQKLARATQPRSAAAASHKPPSEATTSGRLEPHTPDLLEARATAPSHAEGAGKQIGTAAAATAAAGDPDQGPAGSARAAGAGTQGSSSEAEPGGVLEGEGVVPAAAAEDASAVAHGVPGSPPPHIAPFDPLAEFTPRVILQELLGELFIPPERLTRTGTYGQGAFATVQSCSLDDPAGGPSRLVAVKALKPEVLADFEDLRRFLLEANLVRKLRHPNIVSIFGLGASSLDSLEALRSTAYVVMEGMQGGDLRMMVLRQMTGRSPAYSRTDALRWCSHIAAACAYLHETCRPMVIHRDLKLENVLLTGGPTTDRSEAKITDFGLHKRARYSSTADVLIAVTQEWSAHGGSVYWHGAGGGGTVRGGKGRDGSVYGGSTVEASFYGGNAYADGLLACASVHRGVGGNSTSAHYRALASAGLAAVTAARDSTTRGAVQRGVGGDEDGASCPDTAGGDGTAHSYVANGCGGTACSSLPGGDSIRAGSEAAAELGLASYGTANSHGNNPNASTGERERPYLLAFDKRYDAFPSASKFNSTHDLVAMHEAALAAVAASAAVLAAGGINGNCNGNQLPTTATTAPGQCTGPSSVVMDCGNAHEPGAVACAGFSDMYPGGSRRSSTQPFHALPPHPGAMWAPPHVVPPSVEGSVHRKMLALMALESAGAAAGTTSAMRTEAAATAALEGGGAGGGGGPVIGAEAPFSVTEFVRAAAAVRPDDGGGSSGPTSAIVLMRSMSLALQQQQQQQQHQQQQQQKQQQQGMLSGNAAITEPAAPASRGPTRASAAGAAMKTVPEDFRMSMDLGSRPQLVLSGARGSADVSGSGRAANRTASAAPSPPPMSPSPSDSKRIGAAPAANQRDRERVAAAAAARMADATRQVGSLIYMAPELVLSNSYNEKVDVFSFAIIAYELFNGKLLAMKIANEWAAKQHASTDGGPRGPGGLPSAPATQSAEQAAEAGVMSYVMRRSAGMREPLPSWWPEQLRDLIRRCWAQDPGDRPSFSQIFRELRNMEAQGTVVDMDSRDPLREPGCTCVIS